MFQPYVQKYCMNQCETPWHISSIEKRQADLVEQWSTYLPEQLELVQDYKLVTNGNYVLFAISYEAAQMETIFNDCTN